MRAYLTYNGTHADDLCEAIQVSIDPKITFGVVNGSLNKTSISAQRGTSIAIDGQTVRVGDASVTATAKADTVSTHYTFA